MHKKEREKKTESERGRVCDAYISLSRLMAAIFGGWQFSFAEGLINQSLLLLRLLSLFSSSVSSLFFFFI